MFIIRLNKYARLYCRRLLAVAWFVYTHRGFASYAVQFLAISCTSHRLHPRSLIWQRHKDESGSARSRGKCVVSGICWDQLNMKQKGTSAAGSASAFIYQPTFVFLTDYYPHCGLRSWHTACELDVEPNVRNVCCIIWKYWCKKMWWFCILKKCASLFWLHDLPLYCIFVLISACLVCGVCIWHPFSV